MCKRLKTLIDRRTHLIRAGSFRAKHFFVGGAIPRKRVFVLGTDKVREGAVEGIQSCGRARLFHEARNQDGSQGHFLVGQKKVPADEPHHSAEILPQGFVLFVVTARLVLGKVLITELAPQ